MSSDRFISETTFHVRYAETDSMGVVHHAVYLVWFEEGRSAYIREHGSSYAEIEKSGYFLAAAELNAKYRRAARYDQAGDGEDMDSRFQEPHADIRMRDRRRAERRGHV